MSAESSLKLVHSWELDKYLSHRSIRSLSVQHFGSFLSLRRLQVLFLGFAHDGRHYMHNFNVTGTGLLAGSSFEWRAIENEGIGDLH